MPHSSDIGEYYAARAAEYERVYAKPERQADLARLRDHLPKLFSDRSVLEIACGTGYWTQLIATTARSIEAIDVSEETLAVARQKALPAQSVAFRIADAMALPKDLGSFDAVFAGFWWSHIPHRQLDRFLAGLRQHLHPGAVVVLLDNLYVEGSSTPVARRSLEGDSYQLRRLESGQTFEILKNFPTEAELRQSLDGFALDVQYREFGHFWLVTGIYAG